MLKTYDSTLQAYTDHPPKNYDTALSAWVDSPSAKTFDKELNAWVERLTLDIYIEKLAFSFVNGGGYTVSDDKRTIAFTFKSGATGVDHASLKWEGRPVEGGVFMGEFESSDSNLNPDVYFYYNGDQVHSSKMKTQSNNFFGIKYDGPVDMIYINIAPSVACTFSLINLYFGKRLQFDV